MRTLDLLVQDAVANSFGWVVFTVLDLARLVSAECLGGEGKGVSNLFGPDFDIVGMEGSFEPEEAPPGEKEIPLLKARQCGGIKSADCFETPNGIGMILGDEVGMPGLVVVICVHHGLVC